MSVADVRAIATVGGVDPPAPVAPLDGASCQEALVRRSESEPIGPAQVVRRRTETAVDGRDRLEAVR